jgi:hypothetical protein
LLGTPSNRGRATTVDSNQDGWVEVFYIGTDDKLYHTWQVTARGGWSGENFLGTPSDRGKVIAVDRNEDGRLVRDDRLEVVDYDAATPKYFRAADLNDEEIAMSQGLEPLEDDRSFTSRWSTRSHRVCSRTSTVRSDGASAFAAAIACDCKSQSVQIDQTSGTIGVGQSRLS